MTAIDVAEDRPELPAAHKANVWPASQFANHLPTPVLVIDAATTHRNLARMSSYTARSGLKLRPHTKTHKSRTFGQMQLDFGAVGLTVAKAGEAEQMALVADHILMAYPAVDPERCARLAKLARTRSVTVAVDTPFAVEALAAAASAAGCTIGLLVEIDVGMGRTGVATPEDSLCLARQISRTAGVRLDGLACYPGHIWAAPGEQGLLLAAVENTLGSAIDLWKTHGLAAEIVSGGSTPTALQSHLVPSLTEIRPGTYIFNDANTFRGSFCTLDDCAGRIICTVVSDAVKNQVVIDAGTKTLTSDLCLPARDSGHGFIVEYPEAKITRLSEEHGQVDVSECDGRPTVGERITVVPNHICPCVNLQNVIWFVEADGACRPIQVDARGMLS